MGLDHAAADVQVDATREARAETADGAHHVDAFEVVAGTLLEQRGALDGVLDAVRRHARLDDDEARLLTGRERPIGLLRRREDSPLSSFVAPGNAHLGILLPYSPLHHLLVGDAPLVMTSGNLAEEPILRDDEEALDKLTGIADVFLLHNREIHVVCDDSVVRVIDGRECPVRRSRGYAPLPVRLPRDVPSVLAVGGELKAAFCLTKGDHAYIGPHVGDMGCLETLHAFERSVAHFQALFRVSPARVVCDLHPGYHSSRWAAAFATEHRLPLQRVQHHHAHVASVLADNGRLDSGPVIGVCFDGTGYGTDGAIWGGEVLVATSAGFRRAAHLRYVPLPGGDASVERPYRIALAHLRAAGVPWSSDLSCVAACPEAERRVLDRQLTTGTHCVPTSSMGRLFDAVASLIGVRQTITYESQAAIEMETLAEDDGGSYLFDVCAGEPILIDPAAVVRGVVEDRRRGVSSAVMAGRFHRAVADTIVRVAVMVRERTGIETVALSGGVFQNAFLARIAARLLSQEAFEVLTHLQVPPNDGGLSLGQAVIACFSRKD